MSPSFFGMLFCPRVFRMRSVPGAFKDGGSREDISAIRNSIALSLPLRAMLCSLDLRFAFAFGEQSTGLPLNFGPWFGGLGAEEAPKTPHSSGRRGKASYSRPVQQ